MKVKSYQELLVWQNAMQIATNVYQLARRLPNDETFALSSQMRRAAVSIPSNIAEGQERNSSVEFVRYLSIAQGSRAELETQLMLGQMIGYFGRGDIDTLLDNLAELGKMMNSLISSIKSKNKINQ